MEAIVFNTKKSIIDAYDMRPTLFYDLEEYWWKGMARISSRLISL